MQRDFRASAAYSSRPKTIVLADIMDRRRCSLLHAVPRSPPAAPVYCTASTLAI